MDSTWQTIDNELNVIDRHKLDFVWSKEVGSKLCKLIRICGAGDDTIMQGASSTQNLLYYQHNKQIYTQMYKYINY